MSLCTPAFRFRHGLQTALARRTHICLGYSSTTNAAVTTLERSSYTWATLGLPARLDDHKSPFWKAIEQFGYWISESSLVEELALITNPPRIDSAIDADHKIERL